MLLTVSYHTIMPTNIDKVPQLYSIFGIIGAIYCENNR
ncbi:hypothetical protein bthur0005_52500 [Bacillus thuringiensis serovar pakistani str. T13001]|nr:hypothetical protein bthur0005_52500 [Bacillus thuringiensis serovar pakistani str. T13001]